MKIFLWGYMGCGKSYIGVQLAKLLNYEFIDLDKYIEHKTTQKICDIFQERGEVEFRKIEQKSLIELTESCENTVISTGGGTPCFFENASYMNANGVTIFLAPTVDLLLKRLENSKHRPLICKKTAEELKIFVTEQYQKRLPHYQQAQHCIEGHNIRPEDLLPLF